MDAGQLPDLPPPTAAYRGDSQHTPPSEEELALLPDHNPLLAMCEDRVATIERREKFAALGIAVLVHAALIALLAWIVVSVVSEPPPEFVVASVGESTDPTPSKKDFTQSIKRDKPSPPASTATQLLAAMAPSSTAIPVNDEIRDVPITLGTGTFGEGFGGGGAGNGLGSASFFGTTGGGKRIILVVDTSTSMPRECSPSGIAAIRTEISRTITALPPDTEFNIICYGNMADGLFPKPTNATSDRKQNVEAFMKGYFGVGPFPRTRTETFGDKGKDSDGVAYVPIPPDKVSGLKGTSGGSRLDLALVAAFDQKATTIFLITDGAPSTAKDGKRLSENDIVRLVSDEADRVYGRNSRPIVNCISINGIGESILKDVARKFKGKYKSIEPRKL